MNKIPVTKIKCPFCKKMTYKPAYEVKRQFKNGKKIYCSRQCAIGGAKLSRTKYKPYEKSCSICGKKFATSNAKKSPKFCSKSCSMIYVKQFVDKDKISKSVKAAWARGDFDVLKSKFKIDGKYKLKCTICNNDFLNRNISVKTCGLKCRKVLLSKKSRENINCGGETNYKKYKYNDVWMDCSWEVKLAEFLDKNNIEWIRSRKIMFWWTDKCNKKRRYYPDFYLPKYNLYLDPKNKFLINKDEYKINQVVKENNIDLIWGLLDNVIDSLKIKLNMGS